MENQHKHIKGYRDLTEEEVALMNEVKSKGNELEELIERVSMIDGIDEDWLHEGEMTLKKGVMFLVRSIAKPNSF